MRVMKSNPTMCHWFQPIRNPDCPKGKIKWRPEDNIYTCQGCHRGTNRCGDCLGRVTRNPSKQKCWLCGQWVVDVESESVTRAIGALGV